jgi:hypothetical protein
MILGLSTISELCEILQKPVPETVTFFGVKLDAIDVRGLDGATEIRAVAAYCQHVLLSIAAEIIRMQEIESRIRLKVIEQRAGR